MQNQTHKILITALAWILGPISLLHISSYGRVLFENLTDVDFILALICIVFGLFVSIKFRNKSIQTLTIAVILNGILGYVSFLLLPDSPSIELSSVIQVGTLSITARGWSIFGSLTLSLIITASLIQVLSREVLVLKTPFKTSDNRKNEFGKMLESNTILSFVLGLGIYIAMQSVFPPKMNTIYLIQAIISVAILLVFGLSGLKLNVFEETYYFSSIERKVRASKNSELETTEKISKYLYFTLSWLIFTLVISATGFLYFQLLKQQSIFARLIGFHANLMIGAVFVMIISYNQTFNLIIRKLGMIGAIFGLYIFYQTIINSLQIPIYDIVLGFLIFSGIWSFLSNSMQYSGPENIGFWFGISLIIMGYTLLIPSKPEELQNIYGIVQITTLILLLAQIIGSTLRKRHVPTIFQIEDKINNSPDSTREVTEV